MENDRRKWNDRYDCSSWYHGLNPARFLAENIDFIKSRCPGRRAFDVACGEGRNSIFLARHGFRVTAVDISEKGIGKGSERMREEGLMIDFQVAELEGYLFNENFDLIININFLLRDLIPKMVDVLNPGGIILFDSILDAPTLMGQHRKEFLLQPGELNHLFSPFAGSIHHYGEHSGENVPTAKLLFIKSQ